MVKAPFGLCVAALALVGVTGCATKNYVRSQTTPIINHVNELDEKTAQNNRAIHDVDDRAQTGIKQAQSAADSANQNAQNAAKAAGDAETAANNAVHRADSLDGAIKGLETYKPVANVSVTFGFDKAVLSDDSKEMLDNFAQQLTSAKSYILEVTGGTDSTGPADYNYDLSERRANTVVQYLATKYNVPARRFYLIGIGKDKDVAPNNTAEGRKQNRRVEIRMLSNSTQQAGPPVTPAG
jgi:outer membrane protein OmpA-like peptidoglycan-associated protein